MTTPPHVDAFVIVRVRLDSYDGDWPSLASAKPKDGWISFDGYSVTVTEIVATQEEAEKEVARLASLDFSDSVPAPIVRHFWTKAPYLPDGSSFGSGRLRYPEGHDVRVGDLVWWNEGSGQAVVASIVNSKDERLPDMGEPGVFLCLDPSNCSPTEDLWHPESQFEDEGLGLVRPEEREE